MIKIDTTKPTVREVSAPFSAVVDGENVTQQIRVQYRPLSIKEMKEREAKIASDKTSDDALRSKMYAQAITDGKTEEEAEALSIAKYPLPTSWLSSALCERLVGLPDLCNPDESPIEITEAILDTFDLVNLKAIERAINEDMDPKSQPIN